MMDEAAIKARCEEIRLLWRSMSKGNREANVREATFRAAFADGQRAGMERAARVAKDRQGITFHPSHTRQYRDGYLGACQDVEQQIRQAAGEVQHG